MKKTPCIVCSAAKGRRICQLKAHTLICPVCCAQIRNPDCEGCGYWAQANAYAREKTTAPWKEPRFIARIDPEVDAEVDRALVMAEGGRLEVAEKIVSGLLGRDPDLHMVHFAMGVIRGFQGRHDEAVAHFDRAVAIFPYFVEAWFNKGTAHQAKLEVGPMIRAFQKVIELGDPKEDYATQARAMIQEMTDDVRREAGLSLERYLHFMEVFDEAFANMQNRQWARALAGFQEVVAANPKHTQSYGNMGLCYAMLGRKRDALAALNRAVEIDPGYEPAKDNRLRVLAMQDGESLAADFVSTDYYKNRHIAER
jgi:tetratricopeptide (TPR) repeat protein